MRPGLNACSYQSELTRILAGQQLRRNRGNRGGANGGHRGSVEDRLELPGLGAKEQNRALMQIEPSLGVSRVYAYRLEPVRGLVAAPIGGHQTHQTLGVRSADDRTERVVNLTSGECR